MDRLCFYLGIGAFVLLLLAVSAWHFVCRVAVPRVALDGARVVITGGSKGIGYETARECVQRGADVAIVARKEGTLLRARGELVKHCRRKGQKVLAISADVSNFVGLSKAVKGKLKQAKWDTLDAVVCNAGVEMVRSFADAEVEDHRRVMDVNYFGALHTIKACLPFLRRNEGPSRVVVVSSMLGLMGFMYYSSYCASKMALRGLVETLQQELPAYSIYPCIVWPPDVNTDSLKREKAVPVPEEVKQVSEDSGVFEPQVIGAGIARTIEKGDMSVSWGIDGWMLRNLTAGMGPAFSLPDTFAQVFLGGIFRAVALWYGRTFSRVGQKALKQH